MQYKIKKISGDASFREFYKIEKNFKSTILVKANKDKFKNLIVYAAVNEITFHSTALNDFSLSKKKLFSLDKSSFLFIRQDPPYDMTYVTSLHLLELLDKKVKIVNDPIGIRNSPEKLLMLKTKSNAMIPKYMKKPIKNLNK